MIGKLPYLTTGPIGYYKMGVQTGLTAGVGAGSAFFAARWGVSGVNAILLYLRVQMQVITPFTAAQEISLAAQVGRTWSGPPTGGTNLGGLTFPNQVMNSLGDRVSIIDARVAIAGAVGNGTVTLDTNPFLQGLGNQMAAAPVAPVGIVADWSMVPDARNPLLFVGASQEGFIVKNTTLQGAGGTVRVSIELEWLEFNSAAAPGSLV